ncbi:MAG: hypothetical protein IKD88_04970 [Lachnospiraceae bacterium]|nr:hypothetical protein [Lachnospiraceae bacterium]
MSEVRWRSYHGVGVTFDRQVVRIRNDLALKELLRAEAGSGFFRGLRSEYRPARKMARVLKEAYRRKFGEELRITDGSLESEIVWHYRVIEWCRISRRRWWYRLLPPARRFVEWLWIHMDVIDCGDLACDGNRIVWDVLDRWGL